MFVVSMKGMWGFNEYAAQHAVAENDGNLLQHFTTITLVVWSLFSVGWALTKFFNWMLLGETVTCLADVLAKAIYSFYFRRAILMDDDMFLKKLNKTVDLQEGERLLSLMVRENSSGESIRTLVDAVSSVVGENDEKPLPFTIFGEHAIDLVQKNMNNSLCVDPGIASLPVVLQLCIDEANVYANRIHTRIEYEFDEHVATATRALFDQEMLRTALFSLLFGVLNTKPKHVTVKATVFDSRVKLVISANPIHAYLYSSREWMLAQSMVEAMGGNLFIKCVIGEINVEIPIELDNDKNSHEPVSCSGNQNTTGYDRAFSDIGVLEIVSDSWDWESSQTKNMAMQAVVNKANIVRVPLKKIKTETQKIHESGPWDIVYLLCSSRTESESIAATVREMASQLHIAENALIVGAYERPKSTVQKKSLNTNVKSLDRIGHVPLRPSFVRENVTSILSNSQNRKRLMERETGKTKDEKEFSFFGRNSRASPILSAQAQSSLSIIIEDEEEEE